MSASKKRFALVATTTAAVLVGGGVAVAFWTTTGNGTGTAGVGTNTAVTVDQDTTISGLVPGGPSTDIDFTVNNPSDGPQTINGVTVTIASVDKAVGAPAGACTAGDFSLVGGTINGSHAILANDDLTYTSGAGGDVANTGLNISMVNSGSNQDGCKGATVNLNYAVN